jgi:hypothetical protein
MQLTSQSFYQRRKGYKRGARNGCRLLVGDVGRLGQYIQRFDHTPFGTGAAAPLENAQQLLAAEDRVAHSHIQHLYVCMYVCTHARTHTHTHTHTHIEHLAANLALQQL